MDKTPFLECANKVPTNLPPTKRKHSYRTLVATSLAAALMGGLSGLVVSQQDKTLTLSVDGQTRVIETDADTVSAALASAGVEVDSTTVVTPSPSEELEDGTSVSVRYAKPFRVVADGATVSTTVTAVTVEDALTVLELTPREGAYLSEDLDAQIPREGMELVVSNPKKLTLVAKNKKKTVETSAVTVGAFLREQAVNVDSNDELSDELATFTKPGLTVEVVAIDVRQKKERVESKLPVKVREDATLLEGETRVLEKGSPRVVEKTLRLTFADGEVSDRTLLREQVVSRGASRVVVKGTKEPEPTYPEMSPVTPGSARAMGRQMMLAAGFGPDQWSCLDRLWQRESGWNAAAHNPSSGAHGIPQSLPGSKMSTHGADWATNPRTQIAWGLDYIKGRYGSPCAAWGHSESVGWY